jgi:hypothetical protein
MFGPLASKAQFGKVQSLIQAGVDEGAKVEAGVPGCRTARHAICAQQIGLMAVSLGLAGSAESAGLYKDIPGAKPAWASGKSPESCGVGSPRRTAVLVKCGGGGAPLSVRNKRFTLPNGQWFPGRVSRAARLTSSRAEARQTAG